MLLTQKKKICKAQVIVILLACVFTSCLNANESDYVAGLSYNNDIAALAGLKKTRLRKIAKSNDGSLYFAAVKLLKAQQKEPAMKMLEIALNHYTGLYYDLCFELYLSSASVKEQVALLEKQVHQIDSRIKKNNQNNQGSDDLVSEKKLLLEKLNGLYVLQLDFNKIRLTDTADTMADNTNHNSQINGHVKNQAVTYISNMTFTVEEARALSALFEKSKALRHIKTDELFFTAVRVRVFSKLGSKKESFNLMNELLQTAAEQNDYGFLTRAVVSDFGKLAMQYSDAAETTAQLFENTAKAAENVPLSDKDRASILHALYFYAARLYEKKDDAFSDSVLACYEASIKYAPNNADYDNALWYKLKFIKNFDSEHYIQELTASVPTWKNAYWYEDLISDLTIEYTQKKSLIKLQQLAEMIEPTNLAEAKAKLAYIIGRFTDNEQIIIQALDSDSYYYTLLAAYQTKAKTNFAFKNHYKRYDYKNFSSAETTAIITKLLQFGLYDEVYGHIKKYAQTVSVSDAITFSKALAEAGCVSDSINVIQYALRSTGAAITGESLQLLYPRAFSESVSNYALQYEMPEYLVYALIRSESFFKPVVKSTASAVGLTQLMPSTAAAIAAALKMENFDLTDADTNIRFGVYYLTQMFKIHGKNIRAFQAYNAGGGNVRKWKRLYRYDPDIFIEAVPFAETRTYSKNIVTAACMYAQLYYHKTADEVIEELLTQ